jgi:hypothetical protein
VETIARPPVPSDTTDIIVLKGPEPEHFLFQQGIRRFTSGHHAARWWTVSACSCDHDLSVLDAGSFEVASIGGSLAGDGLGGARDFVKRPMHEGQEIELDALTIKVLEVQQGWPTRIQVRLSPETRAHGHVAYLYYSEGALRPVNLPTASSHLRLALAER